MKNTTKIGTQSIKSIWVKKKRIKKDRSVKKLLKFIKEYDGEIVEKKKSYVFKFTLSNERSSIYFESQVFLASLGTFVTRFYIEVCPNN